MSPDKLVIIPIVLAIVSSLLPQIEPSAVPERGGGDDIVKTCSATTYRSLCVSILKSDPRSEGANKVQLAELIVDQVEANAKRALYQIGRLMKTRPGSPKTWEGLRKCTENYDFILMLVDVCRQALPGNPKFAIDHMDGAQEAAGSCEGSFGEARGRRSPLFKVNRRGKKLAIIARDIIRSVLGGG